MSRRILVTGGAGFVGSALVRRLHAEGHDVRVLDNCSRGQERRVPRDVEVLRWDVRSDHLVMKAAEGCDTICHLAYVQGTQVFTENPHLTIDVALKGIMNVLAAAKGKDLLLVSSSETYQSPGPEYFPTAENVPLSVPDVTNPRYAYGGGKIACEIASLAYSDVLNRVVIARLHNAYGPDMGEEHVVPQLARRLRALKDDALGREWPFPVQGTGQETRCFNFIDDAVDGLMLLLDRGENRNVYHVGTDDEITIERLARMLADRLGLHIRVNPSALPKGSPPRRCPDISKMRALGYSPRVSLADGLSKTLAWYREPRVVNE